MRLKKIVKKEENFFIIMIKEGLLFNGHEGRIEKNNNVKIAHIFVS